MSEREKIRKEIIKYSDTNQNENTIYQNLKDEMKVMLRQSFIAINKQLIAIP